jgi:hypothetical protein
MLHNIFFDNPAEVCGERMISEEKKNGSQMRAVLFSDLKKPVAVFYKIPCAVIALATFMNPAMLAPFT